MAQQGFDLLGSLTSVPQTIKKFWKSQTPARRRLIIGTAVLIVVVSIILVLLLNTTQYAVLYSHLSAADAGEIMQKLEEMKVDAKPRGSDTILVPADQVDRLRMELAVAGYPKNNVSLDILQMGSGFGMTEEDKAIYRRYQLQQDLQHCIETFEGVKAASVSLYIPEESDFLIEDQAKPATAAVLLSLEPGVSLSSANVKAISELVQKSVPHLTAEGVTIIDNNMNVLNNPVESSELVIQDQFRLEESLSNRLKQQILSMLQPVFGIDRVLAEVNVSLNFDEKTTDSVRFEPVSYDGTGIISSIDKIRETATQAGTEGNEETDAVPVYPVVNVDDSIYEKNSEKIIYEINSIQEHLVQAKGSIRDLSVSVILDSTAQSGDFTENVRQLVATAVGVSTEYITVEQLPFSSNEQTDELWEDYRSIAEKAMRWEQNRFYLLLIAGAFLILILLAVFIRLVKGTRPPEKEAEALFPSLKRQPSEFTTKDLEELLEEEATEQKKPQKPDNRQIVAEFIDKDPELVASVLRGWLSDEQG